MRDTAEVRWFFPGPVPEPAAAWFDGLGAGPPQTRTDHYLRPTDDALNLKLREGLVEVKRRGSVAPFDAPRAAGTLERWRKWGFRLAEHDAPAPEGEWLAVTKTRRLAHYAVEDGRARPHPGEAPAALGCDVELGRVEVEGAVWWTVCFEAYGAPLGALPDALRRTAAAVLTPAAPPLPAPASLGYPAWLQRVAARP